MAQYSIEIAGSRNDNVIFAPISQRLRGAWDFANTAHLNKVEGPEGAWLRDLSLKVKRIPGQIVVVDDKKMKAAVIDPLGLPENSETMEAMNSVFKAHGKPFESSGGAKPHPTQEYDLDFDGLKLWLYWMRRLLDAKPPLAVLCAGSSQLPTLAEIDKLPGRRRRDPMNTYEQTAETPELARRGEFGIYPWTAEVPVPKGKETATA